MKTPGVPESITRTQLCELLQALGLDPAQLAECHVHRHSVEAVVYATNASGHRYIEGSRAAQHRISIPVVDT
jgi:hypothetical protein